MTTIYGVWSTYQNNGLLAVNSYNVGLLMHYKIRALETALTTTHLKTDVAYGIKDDKVYLLFPDNIRGGIKIYGEDDHYRYDIVLGLNHTIQYKITYYDTNDESQWFNDTSIDVVMTYHYSTLGLSQYNEIDFDVDFTIEEISQYITPITILDTFTIEYNNICITIKPGDVFYIFDDKLVYFSGDINFILYHCNNTDHIIYPKVCSKDEVRVI